MRKLDAGLQNEAGLQNTTIRAELAERVIALLSKDTRIAAVEGVGSLRAESGVDTYSDQYSDVDVQVRLQPGVPDRSLAEDIPALLAPIGPLLADGWAVRLLPSKYARTLYFADYPLFWHVDISCHGDTHVDGSDLLEAYHWPRLFKTWQETLKGVLRGKDKAQPDFVESMLGRWLALPALDSAMSSAARLAFYLDMCAARTRSECAELRCAELRNTVFATPIPSEATIEAFYQRCDSLRREYLTRQE